MFKDIFSKLLLDRDISAYKLSKDTGISNATISEWKAGIRLPSLENLVTLSDYFSLTSDFFLDREPVKKQSVPVVLEYFMSLSPDDRRAFIQEAVKHI